MNDRLANDPLARPQTPADRSKPPLVRIEHLRFTYRGSSFQLDVPQLQVAAGERVAFVGPSGSGKTTLLNLVAGILLPHAGSITVDELRIDTLADTQRRNFRIRRIGMVFQQFELVEYLSVLENILLPYRINHSLRLTRHTRQQAESLAASMGLADKLRRGPGQLSQGEQQRVAVCRALITDPQLLLADEPTGNLDPTNKRRILDILFARARHCGVTLVVVTHDHGILDGFDRVIDFETFHSTSTDSPSTASPSTQGTPSAAPQHAKG